MTVRCTGCGEQREMTREQWEKHHDHYVATDYCDPDDYWCKQGKCGHDTSKWCGEFIGASS